MYLEQQGQYREFDVHYEGSERRGKKDSLQHNCYLSPISPKFG